MKKRLQELDLAPKNVLGYKLLGERFKCKKEANSAITNTHRKGFMSTRLCIIAGEFVLQFATYDKMKDAKASQAAIKAAGFNVELVEITK